MLLVLLSYASSVSFLSYLLSVIELVYGRDGRRALLWRKKRAQTRALMACLSLP